MLALVAAAGVLGVSGCQSFSPVTTEIRYEPSDGVAVDMEGVEVLNLLVVAESEGATGILSGYVVNETSDPVTLTITTDPAGAQNTEVEVPPGTLRLDGGGDTERDPVTIESVSQAPGAMVPVSIHTPAAGQTRTQAPVLLPDGPYATLTPSP